MLRKIMIAFAAVTIGTCAVASESFARGFHGGGFHGHHHFHGFGFYPYGYGYQPYSSYYDEVPICYQVRRRVMTRHGWRIRRVRYCS